MSASNKTNFLGKEIPAGIQFTEMTFDYALTRLNNLMAQEDQTIFSLGDFLSGMETKFGKKTTLDACDTCHITKTTARQMLKVARRFPKGHKLRDTHLTYAHFGVLVKLKDDADVEKWAKLAANHQWSVSQLVKEIEAANDEQAQQDGHPCIQCECRLPEDGEIVSFRVGRKKRARCCDIHCATEYFNTLRKAGDFANTNREDSSVQSRTV